MSDAPVPAPPAPPRQGARPVGCLPFLVFVLTVASAAGVVALRADLLPKEEAGRVVIEILDKPSREAMKAHATRIQSGAVLEQAANDLGGAQPRNVREDIRDRLQKDIKVTASGPFLTVTVFEKNWSPAAVANAVAEAYNHDLNLQADDVVKRQLQNLIGQITLNEATTEKARLEWLDIMKKHDLRPDAGSIGNDVISKGIAARLAGDTIALVMVESDIQQMDAADPMLADKKSDAGRLGEQIKSWQKAAKEQDRELLSRLQRRSEMDEAKHRYERQVRLVHTLREETMNAQVRNGVVRRPTRIVEEARTIQVPDRRVVKLVRLGTAACALLLAALLLSAMVSRLCRRA